MKNPQYPRILAIAPSSRGLGYAVFEGQGTLLDWGGKEVSGKYKNAGCVKKAEELIVRHSPDVLVLEYTASEGSRRSLRIRELTQKLVTLARKRKVNLKMLSRKQVIKAFFPDGKGTKHNLAEIIADRFPTELGFRLPPKRKPWKSEDSRMDIFVAVALAMANQSGYQHQLLSRKY